MAARTGKVRVAGHDADLAEYAPVLAVPEVQRVHPGRELDSVLLERRSRDAVDVLVDVLVREL